jgi:hypothetical protein
MFTRRLTSGDGRALEKGVCFADDVLRAASSISADGDCVIVEELVNCPVA